MSGPPTTGILRADIEVIRPGVQGDWPMLFDPQADAYYRIDRRMMEVVSRLDEDRPLDEFRRKLERGGIEISLEELAGIIDFLRRNNLLAMQYGEIGVHRARHRERKEKTTFLRLSSAYLFFRLPPWRPEKFFRVAGPYLTFLASRPFLLLLTVPAVLGYLLLVRDFGAVRTTFADSLSWAGLAKYFAAILFLKLVHEAAHAVAAVRFGCRIRGIGIGFMVFYPRLYTDTTDSWRLPRRERLLIDGAGIIIELLLGGVAALLWHYLPPGVWKSTMFYIFAVSTISTLFINGNPCIRYDGYYILCDLTGIENLMTRSGEYLKQFWRWHFLRLGAPPQERHGAFLLCFGAASFLYRLFLYTSIILIIYHKFVKAVALVLLVLELYSILIYPLYREFDTVRRLSLRSANRARRYFAVVLLLAVSGILFLPLAWNIRLPGEVVPAERRPLAVAEPGYLKSALPARSVPVAAGELLFELDSPQLEFLRRRQEWNLRADRALFDLQQVDEELFSGTAITREKLRADATALEESQRRRAELTVRAGASGVFVPRGPDLSAGTFFGRGYPVGELVSESTMVYAYASDRDAGKIAPGQEVVVRVADSLRTFPGKVRSVDAIPARLRNSALLQQFGGPVPVYQNEKSPGEYLSVFALYRIEIEFDGGAPSLFPGRTADVEIRYSERLFDRLFQFLLGAFRREF